LSRSVGSTLTGGELRRQLFRPTRAQVEVNGVVWPETQYTAVIASTIEQVGLGFRPNTRCRERARSFHLQGMLASTFDIVKLLPRIRLGMNVPQDAMRGDVCDKAVITPEDVVEYMIDGDLHPGFGPLTITAGPR